MVLRRAFSAFPCGHRPLCGWVACQCSRQRVRVEPGGGAWWGIMGWMGRVCLLCSVMYRLNQVKQG